MSLDGYFEGRKKWDLEFHNHVWGDELERLSIEQLRGADAILFGRVTYEGMAAYWPSATGEVANLMNAIPKFVFSHSLASADWQNTTLVPSDAPGEVAKLKKADGQDLLVFGSAELSASLMERDLFDEYRLCVVPVVLGAGTPLFKHRATERLMTLRQSRQLATGGVILQYEPLRAQ